MCLSPINIYSPARNIAIRGGQKLRMSVACGKCAHCVARKRDEYSFRTYYHAKDCITKGGYVLFDTLTYADEYLPHIHDYIDFDNLNLSPYDLPNFSCFNRRHYQLFFKRLRKRIYHKYGLTDSLSYFFASEYGADDRYTHRPHYHVLIFVNTPKIHPLWLSRTISQCWQYGRTDGICYKSFQYVSRHIYGYTLGESDNSTPDILRAVTHYVAKYVNKSSLFQFEIDKRLNILATKLSCLDNCLDIVKSVYSQVRMFHQQSQGYGLAYLNMLNSQQKSLLQEDKCSIPDKLKVNKVLPLPMYYVRKLYYHTVKRADGRVSWELTENGINHKIHSYITNLQNLTSSYETLYSNCAPEQKSYIDLLLADRSLLDLSLYVIFYYGRLRHYNSCNYYTGLSDLDLSEPELLECNWLDSIKDSYSNNSHDLIDIFSRNDSNDVYINNYLSTVPIEIDSQFPYFKLDIKDFVRTYTFNQNSSPQFKDLDILISYFNHLKRLQFEHQQSTFDYKLELKDKLKPFTHVKSD